jgi:hypothetical protein
MPVFTKLVLFGGNGTVTKVPELKRQACLTFYQVRNILGTKYQLLYVLF